MSGRELKFHQALREALDQCMERDPSVYVMGLGVPDPKGVFGTTLGLAGKYGPMRALDMPTAENGMTGIAIGSALVGMRPVMVHQRLDFALLAVEQVVNQAAKWHYMFGGKASVPLVVRLVTGRGWGQGPQHSQSLQAWFAHVPGLKVVLPSNPRDAKGLLAASIEDDNPVIFIENRWLHNVFGDVPENYYTVPIGKARVARTGTDLTIVAVSYMVPEALKAAEHLAADGINIEVIDVRTLRPLDVETIVLSVERTGRVIVADTGCRSFGAGAEIVAAVVERAWGSLKAAPVRLGLLDSPIPTSPALSPYCYPTATDLIAAACSLCDLAPPARGVTSGAMLDVPDSTFTGPF